MIGLKDVAQLAGVDVGTASRVLNRGKGVEWISAGNVQRVESAAQLLGYRANYHARSMRSGKAQAIGLILPGSEDLMTGFQAYMVAGVGISTRAMGYQSVSVGPTAELTVVDNGLAFLQERRIDGLIVPAYHLTDGDIARLEATERPIVLMNCARATTLPVVALDAAAGIVKAVSHLAGLGHRKALWVGLDEDRSGPASLRHAAFRKAVQEWSMEPVELLIRSAPRGVDQALDIEEARDAMAEFLTREDSYTGIVCYNDRLAIGVYSALQSAGKIIPVDYSLVGFDDVFGDAVCPSMTTVSHMFQAIGAACIDLIVEMGSADSAWKRARGRRISVTPDLVIRKSTSVPRGSQSDSRAWTRRRP